MKFLPSILAAVACLGSITSQAATIGYWRMELDNDGAVPLSVPNEVAGGNPLTAASANITNDNTTPPGVPVPIIPLTGAPNNFSLNGNANIDGSVASSAALNTSSITIEFWARTQEGTATLLARGGTTSGFAIDSANALQITYFTDNGAGGGTSNVLLFGLNFDIPWRHVAFTYDATLGIGTTYVDGAVKNTFDGPDGRSLFWGAGTTSLSVGSGMDGGTLSASTGAGVLDEVRLSDTALNSSQFLNAVPEPSTAISLAGGVAILLSWRRRRRPHR